LLTIDKNIDLLEKLKTVTEKHKKDVFSNNIKIKNENEKLKSISVRVKDLKLKIEEKAKTELGIDIDGLRANFDKKVSEYSTVKSNISKKNEDIKINSLLVDILSDNGVKSYFMDKMLPWLNFKINEYLEMFDFTARITINASLVEKIETLSGVSRERSYFSFSGGERKIIDVSVWLAFIDSVKMFLNWNSNLLFIDELFDEGTDSETIEKILISLRQMCNDKKMHISIISHKNPEVVFDGKYLARKVNGFSKIEKMN
jgi:hypothetical protein